MATYRSDASTEPVGGAGSGSGSGRTLSLQIGGGDGEPQLSARYTDGQPTVQLQVHAASGEPEPYGKALGRDDIGFLQDWLGAVEGRIRQKWGAQ